MWNEKLEHHAAKMRVKFARMAELLAGQAPDLDPVRRQYGNLARLKGLQVSWEKKRQRGNLLRSQLIEIQSHQGHTFKDPAKRSVYPPCPRCNDARPEGTIRAGFARGIQRFRCLCCRGTFSGPIIAVKLEVQDYPMVCYHCGSANTQRKGRSFNETRTGRVALCLSCNKSFVQGGLKDLQKYHLLLEKRIMDLKLPDDVEAEVLQIATMDVLIGKGYCWTVELKTKEAFRNCRGEYGQRGSDHPKFREQMGQKLYDD